MKKLPITIALTTLFSLSVFANPVDVKTAQKAATTFLNNNGAKATQLTDLSEAAGFPNLYIFTTENSFVVMSADDCVQPILGYSLTGKFVAEGMPENLTWWLKGYSDQIQDIKDQILPADAYATIEWQKIINGLNVKDAPTVIVSPLTTTLWDQSYPYNYYCPVDAGGSGGHAITGCVATAMAQVMKYWNYPSTGNDSHTYTHPTYGEQTANFGLTSYDWTNMPNSLNGNSSQAQIEALATLMYHCGVSVDMNYGAGISGASSNVVAPALINYFRYAPSATFVSKSAYTDEQWKTFLKSELDEGRPLYYSGNNTNSGHAFVCDGYRSDDYFHFNWGWSGYDGSYGSTHGNNGYWAIGSLSPGSGGSGSGSGTYNLNNAVIAWLEPISTLTAPTLTAEATNVSISLSWNAIENADSYDIYRDNEKIATGITVNNYVDNDVISGIYYQYYVRSVTGETRSNPSNRVTKSTFYRNHTPSGLSASLDDNDVSLSWNAPVSNGCTLQYAIGASGTRYGMGEGSDCYWAEVFDPSRLSGFEGMYIEKVSAYLYLPGNYTLFIYQDNTDNEENRLYEESFSIQTTGNGWKDIELTTPVLIDCSKELWIVMFYPYTQGSQESYWYPATCGSYDEIQFDNEEDDERYNPRLIGDALNNWYYIGKNISWLMRTYLTDGTYTYNLYDGTTTVASNINATNYTVSNVTDNSAHQYTVKTNYYGGESAASNMAGLTLGTASLSSLELGENDKMTITEGSKLTVSGTLNDVNVNNLILENGAQLVHNSANVQATVKKDIMPYTNGQNDGWSLVASPIIGSITPNADNGWLSNEYDLYKFDQSEDFEWRNIEASSFATVDHKTGYLYANSDNTTLTIAGTLAATTAATPLAYDASATWKGFNLIGNPYPCNAYINRSFYVLHEITEGSVTNTEFTLGSGAIPPCAAILVQAQGANESVSFSKTPVSKSGIMATLTKAGTRTESVIDRARINFNSNDNLSKYTLSTNASKIYIAQGEQGFAVASAKGENEMSLNFKAAQNGTYALRFDVENLELDYLHLIDNMTGNDIDLLITPSYTFEARTSDYASRFRLVFTSDDAIDDDETFAYIHQGEIIINNVEMCQGASIEVVDMTGRVIVSRDTTNRISTSEMAAGVYVLRLINGNSIKMQKIVIE